MKNSSDTIKEFLSRKSGISTEQISDTTKILESGIIRSMVVLEMIAHLENVFSIEMSETDLIEENFRDINALGRLLDRLRNVNA